VREFPEWTFVFLTKNPARLPTITWPDNAWVGTTVDVQARVKPAIDALKQVKAPVRFVSCEPFLEELTFPEMPFEWLIIGGRSKTANLPEFQPKWDWVQKLVVQARKNGIAIYFKPNLRSGPNLTTLPKEKPRRPFDAGK